MSARDDVRRAAQALTDRGEALFSPIELITQARENGCAYPDVTLRTHIVNYMCINAGGPSAGRYPDLIRVSRGLYRLANNSQSAPSVRRASTVVASIRTPRETRARHNVDALIDDFDNSLSTFESVEVFSGPSLYFHVRALERRRQASSAAVLLKDERFLEYVYAVLPSWGMHRMGNQAAKVPDFEEFARSLQACRSEIEMLWALDITAIEDATVRQVGHQLWSIIGRLRASTSASRLVSGSKTLHHVLPDLMPPIDREYTFKFFTGQAMLSAGEEQAFADWWPYLCEIGRSCSSEILAAVGRAERMATSSSKVIDNAIIGFMRSRR
jgi:hypothetical protein